MIHVGAGQAERPLFVHDQQAVGAATLGAGPVLDRLDDNQVGRSGLTLGDAFTLSGGNIGGNPMRPPGGLLQRVPIGKETQRSAVPGRGNVVSSVRVRPCSCAH